MKNDPHRYLNDPVYQRKVRAANFRRKFGITIDDYERLLKEQDGRCAICRQPETRTWKGKLIRLSVDHNHKTKKVRALLCGKCNVGIGVFLESVLLLEQAKQYLLQHGN